MVDKISPERRSANMRAIRNSNTKPELAVRRLAHRLGYRFRLHRKELPGKPDIVFPGKNSVIFVHGCFWHMHNCAYVRVPKSNLSYWHAKLLRNRDRDQENVEALRKLGWRVLTIWECETSELGTLEVTLRTFLGDR